jgi:hypothetical protein
VSGGSKYEPGRSVLSIGTLQENSLHAALKDWYSTPGDQIEQQVDGYWIDIVRGNLLIEIQTRNFSAIKNKLHHLLEKHPVRLVYPIPQEKWIVRLPIESNQLPSRRKSPRHGRLVDVFRELVRIPHLVAHPNFSLEVLLTREEEIRRNDGLGSWRRQGWSIADRRLLEVVNCIRLETPSDFTAFLPDSLPERFTNRDLATLLGIPQPLASKTAYSLRSMGLVEITGKRGRAYLYERKVT